MIQYYSQGKSRRGAAFLILVVLLLLVLVSSTKSLVQGEWMTRRSDANRVRLKSMRLAIAAVEQSIRTSAANAIASPIELPLDVTTNEYIEVAVSDDRSQITAQWHQGDRVIDEMKQVIKNQEVESTE